MRRGDFLKALAGLGFVSAVPKVGMEEEEVSGDRRKKFRYETNRLYSIAISERGEYKRQIRLNEMRKAEWNPKS